MKKVNIFLLLFFTIGIVNAQWQKLDGPNNCPFTCFAIKGDTILAGVSKICV